MVIELTPEQRLILENQGENTVEVVDPATRRVYVLLSLERYDQVRPFLEQSASPDVPNEENRIARTFPQRLADLPTSPELAAQIRRCSQKRGFWGRASRPSIEEELKLQFYYGGLCVNYLRTAQGIVVMAVGRSGASDYQKQLDAVPPEQRQQLILSIPPCWDDELSEILPPTDLCPSDQI